MEEPKKVLRSFYLGAMQVTKSTGMEILNDAIEQMLANNPKEQWKAVNVAVAPSMISISLPGVNNPYKHLKIKSRTQTFSNYSLQITFFLFPFEQFDLN